MPAKAPTAAKTATTAKAAAATKPAAFFAARNRGRRPRGALGFGALRCGTRFGLRLMTDRRPGGGLLAADTAAVVIEEEARPARDRDAAVPVFAVPGTADEGTNAFTSGANGLKRIEVRRLGVEIRSCVLVERVQRTP
jgi:hypothetical protein